jgi:hypothetical protein
MKLSDDSWLRRRQIGIVLGTIAGIVILVGGSVALLSLFNSSPPGGPTSSTGRNTPTSINTATTSVSSTPTIMLGPTATATSRPVPTATPVPPGTVLYQAPASWAGWGVGSEWTVSNGMLINDGSAPNPTCGLTPTIAPPLKPSTPNYSIVLQVQFPTTGQNYGNKDGCFGISARVETSDGETIGYSAQLGESYTCSLHAVALGDTYTLGATYPVDPGADWHTYRFDVTKMALRFYIDGALSLSSPIDPYENIGPLLAPPGRIGLWGAGSLLYIRSFEVIAL